MVDLIERLQLNNDLTDDQLKTLISTNSYDEDLYKSAVTIREKYYGRDIYLRGLIEISNFCKNDCYYCGIRHGNSKVSRYRLSCDEIIECCREGYSLGYRTFVLQGGEDPWYSDDKMCKLIFDIKSEFPDCAITLSLGEKSKDSYKAYFDAGADRYLLRHETANNDHYKFMHPESMSLDNRKRCLFDLKDIGYSVGSGFMVGSPGQKMEHLVEDIRFLQELEPDMIGIGPYLKHKDTPFNQYTDGSLEQTLRMISILRHVFPSVLLPATTAMGTIDPIGREKAIKAGANVVMPNLSPTRVRPKYEIYEDKICTGDESAQCRNCINTRMEIIGYNIVEARGDRANERR